MRIDRLTIADIASFFGDSVDVCHVTSAELPRNPINGSYISMDKPLFVLNQNHWTLYIPNGANISYFDPYGLSLNFGIEAVRLVSKLPVVQRDISYQPANTEDKLCGNYCVYALCVWRHLDIKTVESLHRELSKFLVEIPKRVGYSAQLGAGSYPLAEHHNNTFLMIVFSVKKEVGATWSENKKMLNMFKKYIATI
jgi:hypothetical protein